MAYLIPHDEPSISLTLDLHEVLLVLDAMMERRRERFGQPFPEGSQVSFDGLVAMLGSEEDAEDFLAMLELESALLDTLQVFDEPGSDGAA